eukprot:15480374-Alexandrium_andersonii.AAC.1
MLTMNSGSEASSAFQSLFPVRGFCWGVKNRFRCCFRCVSWRGAALTPDDACHRCLVLQSPHGARSAARTMLDGRWVHVFVCLRMALCSLAFTQRPKVECAATQPPSRQAS